MNNFINYNECSKNNIITKKNTIIILDWDDTLFPTTWVTKNGINLTDLCLSDLDDILSEFLIKLQEYGQIIIITNALPIWVKVSSGILIKTNKIINNTKIISARKIYKNSCSNMMDWKKMAFKDEIIKLIDNNNFLNIISIGDAEYEYIALINLYKSINKQKILKAIKLMNHPTNEILIDQLKVLSKVCQNICLNQNNLDLKFKTK